MIYLWKRLTTQHLGVLKITNSSILFLTVLVLSCSNEFDINQYGEPSPVVYCVLDPFSDEYYATVRKTFPFLHLNTSLDSCINCYSSEEIDISLELWNDTVRLWYTEFDPLENNLIPSGSNIRNGCFKALHTIPINDSSMEFTDSYPNLKYLRLIIGGAKITNIAYSRVEIYKYPEILKPRLTNQNVRFYGPEPFGLAWQSNEHIRYFDLYFRIYFKELSQAMQISQKYCEFIYSKDIQSEGQHFRLAIKPDLFYSKLAKSINKINDSIINRQFVSFSFFVVGGDNNFEDYMTYQKNETGMSTIPWTNITNGLGVFALKYLIKKEKFGFHQESLDSLAFGQFTSDLGFVNW